MLKLQEPVNHDGLVFLIIDYFIWTRGAFSPIRLLSLLEVVV